MNALDIVQTQMTGQLVSCVQNIANTNNIIENDKTVEMQDTPILYPKASKNFNLNNCQVTITYIRI